MTTNFESKILLYKKFKKNENKRIIIRITFMPIIEKYLFSKNNNYETQYIVHLLWIQILKAKYYYVKIKKKK